MKNIIKLSIVLFSISFLFVSCQDDEPPIVDLCAAVNCQNDGTCVEGICDCPLGYAGSSCENFDLNEVQALLDDGQTPYILFNAGIPIQNLIGKSYQGGIIFSMDASNGRGLLAYPTDIGTGNTWGCEGDDILSINNVFVNPPTSGPATEEGARIGDGVTNTDHIVSICPEEVIAAKLCRGIGSSWSLPSIGELNLMYTNLHLNGLGGFEDSAYWSSTEANLEKAWARSFFQDNQFRGFKSDKNLIRAIRNF